MIEIILDSLIDGAKDTLFSTPILYITYLFMEMLEGSSRLNEETLCRHSKRFGPVIGGILGVIPQCGLSAAAATLYSTGTVTLGTMLAVFFATSDEMLPVMLSSLSGEFSIGLRAILLIIAGKAFLGIILGYISDFAVKLSTGKNIHAFCEREHCECDDDEGNVFMAALIHTVKIVIMLFAVCTILNIIIGIIGVETISGSVINEPLIGEILAGLFGLIPNCSVSVILTESYLTGLLSTGSLFAGLLSNAGIGLIVLFRTNRSLRENLIITGVLYGLSVIAGLAVSILF